MSDDKDFDPALYDVMRELATQLSGAYVEWMREAEDADAREHWRAEHLRVMREVRAVDPDDLQAIEEHTLKLRTQLASMPRHAPAVE